MGTEIMDFCHPNDDYVDLICGDYEVAASIAESRGARGRLVVSTPSHKDNPLYNEGGVLYNYIKDYPC